MAVSSTQATAMLGALPSPLYIQAHTGDPGAAGTANTIGTRGTVTLNAASGGQRTASGNSDCSGITLGSQVTHVSYWDAVSGGTFRFSQPLDIAVSFTYAGTLRFTSQTFTIGSATAGSQTSTSVNTDAGTSAESNTIRLGVNVSDTGSGSDTTWASQGPLSVTEDTGSGAGVVVVALTVVVADTGSSSDSNTPTEVDGVAPSVGTLTVPDTSGTSITGIDPGTSTDAVGITGWKILEQAADSGWPNPGEGDAAPGAAGWTAISSTTSWAPGATLSFTSGATSTGTRYFRLYCKDAAGNVGASATDSATITIAAGGFANGDFETALSGSLVVGNWQAVIGLPANVNATQIAERTSTSPIAGTYSGRLDALGYDDGENPVEQALVSLVQKITKAEIASTPTLAFRCRNAGGGTSTTVAVFVEVNCFDVSNANITNVTDYRRRLKLWGSSGGTGIDTSIAFVPSGVTVYDKSFNLNTFAESILAAGKVAGDISYVTVSFYAYASSTTEATLYVDGCALS